MPKGFINVPNVGQQLVDNVGSNIAGIVSTRPQAKYVSGARTILRVNGKIAAFAFGISWNIVTAYKEIGVIDNPLAEELVPQRIRVDGTISAMHMPGFGPGVQLWQADVLDFLFHQYIQIEVRDSVTSQLLFYAPRAAITTRREEIRVDNLAHLSLNFIAIGFRDEKDPVVPDNVDTLSKPTKSISDAGDAVPFKQDPIGDSSSAVPTTEGEAADFNQLYNTVNPGVG